MAGSQSSNSNQFNTSTSNSTPLNPEQLAAYWRQMDQFSGGRLNKYADTGTEKIDFTPDQSDLLYKPIADERIKSLGGLGATRQLTAQRGKQQAVEQVDADPRLSTFQRQRSLQLTNRDFQDALDAIGKETEGTITNFAADQAAKEYASQVENRNYKADQRDKGLMAAIRNAGLKREDLLALAELYFGGKGQISSASSWGRSASSGSGWNVL